MFMGLSNIHTLRTIEMTQDLCLPMPHVYGTLKHSHHVYGTLKHSHTQNNRNDTKTCVSQCPMFMGLSNTHTLRTIEMTPRLVSPNAPCLWDSQTLAYSEQ